MNRYTYFLIWLRQRESHIDPKQMKKLALFIGITGLIAGNRKVIILGIAYFIFNWIMINYEIYSRRQAYENWYKSHSGRGFASFSCQRTSKSEEELVRKDLKTK